MLRTPVASTRSGTAALALGAAISLSTLALTAQTLPQGSGRAVDGGHHGIRVSNGAARC